jgi:hypothetical protein
MTPTIPIPTDSIYKFYALCGLAFVISSLLGAVYINDRGNERAAKYYVEFEVLNRKDNLSQEEEITKDVLNQQLQIGQSNRKLFMRGLGVMLGIGVLGIAAGFIPWHIKVQPNQDKLLELQIKKIEREILALDKELE